MSLAVPAAFLAAAELDRLIDALRAQQRRVIGPVVSDGAIVYAEVNRSADLAIGWRADQSPGHYRLVPDRDGPVFGSGVGPTSPKAYTFPAELTVSTITSVDGRLAIEPVDREAPRLAIIGARACDLAAIAVQERVFTTGPLRDTDFSARREATFIVALECSSAASTCFCTSMGTGPEVTGGHDLVLTEVEGGFVARPGSAAGVELLRDLDLPPAGEVQISAARSNVAALRAAIGDPLPMSGVPDRLMDRLDHPRWAEVGDRCLSCTNCTMVCPTCFCSGLSQKTDLDATTSTVERRWDSCFTEGFARVAGGNFRPRRQDRYRQWLTHKFATWVDQFGTSGCVGCGRCVTWCPVGIDVREEISIIAAPPALAGAAGNGSAPASTDYLPARIVSVTSETPDTSTFLVERVPGSPRPAPGQFAMLQLLGHPPFPISVSGIDTDRLQLTVRAVGQATRALLARSAGEQIGLRGPLGRGWPLERAEGRDVVIVAGGIGLAPLRPLVRAIIGQRERFGSVLLAVGSRTPGDELYTDELAAWAGSIEVERTVDRGGPGWQGPVGVVTQLLDHRDWSERPAVAFLCGPERMMQATVGVLRQRGIGRKRIFVTLERHMQCGVGLCGHCQMGPFFVCRDGPVFSASELGDLFSVEGI